MVLSSLTDHALTAHVPLWVKSRHDALKSRCPLFPQKRTLLSTTRMSALCQKQTFWRLLGSLGAGWRISSSECYRNAHQGGANGYHCKAHCPWPKPCMTRKNESAKK